MIFPQCLSCKHRVPGLTCAAFPAGIPETILLNLHDHKQPYPGDHGILFEPKPEPVKPSE